MTRLVIDVTVGTDDLDMTYAVEGVSDPRAAENLAKIVATEALRRLAPKRLRRYWRHSR